MSLTLFFTSVPSLPLNMIVTAELLICNRMTGFLSVLILSKEKPPSRSQCLYQGHMNKSGLRSYSHRPGPLYLISILSAVFATLPGRSHTHLYRKGLLQAAAGFTAS